jgi:hypothetical protein
MNDPEGYRKRFLPIPQITNLENDLFGVDLESTLIDHGANRLVPLFARESRSLIEHTRQYIIVTERTKASRVECSLLKYSCATSRLTRSISLVDSTVR